jgi:hypothetical protein
VKTREWVRGGLVNVRSDEVLPKPLPKNGKPTRSRGVYPPEYLSLQALSEYSGISIRALRSYLKHPQHPLVCYRPGGKVLVLKSDFDSWIARFREVGSAEVDAVVEETMRELRAA